MAKNHLKTINSAISQIEKLKADVERVKEQLQSEYDELPFETQDSEYGEELQSALDSLEEVLWEGLETAEDELRNVVGNLEMLPMCDRGLEDEEDDFADDSEDDFSASLAAGALYFGLKAGRKEEKKPDNQPLYDYYDTHWETSFDWKDEDNDGYDDRDDGFWTP